MMKLKIALLLSMSLKLRALIVALSVVLTAGIAVRAISAQYAAPVVQAMPPADLVLRNGRIVTVDDTLPEGQALAARGGKIVAIGSNAEIAKYVGSSTQVIDLAGRFAMPGFIEGHGHFSAIGEGKLGLDLMGTTSWDQIVKMVADAVKRAKPGEWIVGRGWHQDKWTPKPQPNVEGFPLHASLDAVSPNNPVVLAHASGHGSYVNAKAMELSGIMRNTPNPNGGEILKDAKGEPVGFLRENASGLVRVGAGAPKPTAADAAARNREALLWADQEVTAKGITSFQDAGSSFGELDLIKAVIDEGKMHVRLWEMAAGTNAELDRYLDKYRVIGYGGNHLTIRAIKTSADGALGSRGAWLLEPYADKPDSAGLPSSNMQTMPETAKIAAAHNFQLCVHAIGDRANREVLNIYEAAFKAAGKNGRDLRWRIEHAQHISAADIPRFGQLGVIASMQAIHCTSDGLWAPDRLGNKRAEEGAYVWQKLMKSGAVVTNGTDAPVEDVDPISNYYAAVTRKLGNGKVFYADQRMSRMEALKACTIQNAFAAFEENVKGSLTVGKLADITVLSKDITKAPDEEIKTAKVMYTIIGGKVVYKAK
jgi:predicted amidohydrolase YtcJ